MQQAWATQSIHQELRDKARNLDQLTIGHDEDQNQKNDKNSAHNAPTGLALIQPQIFPMAKKARKAPSQEELETASGGVRLSGPYGFPSQRYVPREDQMCRDYRTRPEGNTNGCWFKESK